MTHRPTLSRRPALWIATTLAAFAVVGCVAAPGSSGAPGTATPGATASPTPPPTASPTPTPTPVPTDTPSAPPSPSPIASPSASGCGVATWATGPKDLVLRVTIAGGFVAPGIDLGHAPMLSVYGDGHAIVEGPQIMIYPGPLLPNLQVEILNAAGMRRLLDAAAAAGLLVPDVTYPSYGIADAPTTFFLLAADGCTHRVNADALIESDMSAGLDKPTLEARAKLLAFRNAVSDLATLVGADNVSAGGTYVATGYRIISRTEPAGSVANGTPVKWPLTTPLATFGEPSSSGVPDLRCGVATAADAAALKPLFERANTETRWSSGGKTYVLIVRPTLPHETSCNDPIF